MNSDRYAPCSPDEAQMRGRTQSECRDIRDRLRAREAAADLERADDAAHDEERRAAEVAT